MLLLFEVDEKKVPSQDMKSMDVKSATDALEKELQQIKKVLQEMITGSYGLHPAKEIGVIVDKVIDHICVDDPTLAEVDGRVLKTDAFVLNANTSIVENCENLPEKIREVLEIKEVNVNYFF